MCPLNEECPLSGKMPLNEELKDFEYYLYVLLYNKILFVVFRSIFSLEF